MAACIAEGPSKVDKTAFERGAPAQSLPGSDRAQRDRLLERVELVKRADRSLARLRSARVSGAGQLCRQSCARCWLPPAMACSVWTGSRWLAWASRCWRAKAMGCHSAVIRAAADAWVWTFSETEKTPEHFAREAVRQAIVQLDAAPAPAPAGEMTVVLGPGWPGSLAA